MLPLRLFISNVGQSSCELQHSTTPSSHICKTAGAPWPVTAKREREFTCCCKRDQVGLVSLAPVHVSHMEMCWSCHMQTNGVSLRLVVCVVRSGSAVCASVVGPGRLRKPGEAGEAPDEGEATQPSLQDGMAVNRVHNLVKLQAAMLR